MTLAFSADCANGGYREKAELQLVLLFTSLLRYNNVIKS